MYLYFLFYTTMSECMIFYGPTVPEINYSIILLSVAPPGDEKNTNSHFLRFFVRSVGLPLFRSLMTDVDTYAYMST